MKRSRTWVYLALFEPESCISQINNKMSSASHRRCAVTVQLRLQHMARPAESDGDTGEDVQGGWTGCASVSAWLRHRCQSAFLRAGNCRERTRYRTVKVVFVLELLDNVNVYAQRAVIESLSLAIACGKLHVSGVCVASFGKATLAH